MLVKGSSARRRESRNQRPSQSRTPNTTAVVELPGAAEPAFEVGAGRHHWSYDVDETTAARWADEPSS